MIILDEVKHDLSVLGPEVKDMGDALAIPANSQRYEELTQKSSEPGFFDDAENSRKVFAEMSGIKEKLDKYAELQQLYSDAETFAELAEEMGDEDLLPEAEEHVEKVREKLEELRLIALLSGEYDDHNAILTFHAGAGGTEAQDWVGMLYRMYTRFAARHGFEVEVLDYLDGDEAGIKSASVMVKGTNAYGFLKSENGVHRLVRISPFDSSGRRHTSFASLEVMPEIDDDYDIEINPADLKIDTYRSGGAGGQHVNKTESAIRITHLPTGTVVECQDERSQHKNKEKAMKILRSRLYERMLEEQNAKIASERKLQVGTGDRSERIRTYNYPQGRLTDHRIGLTLYRLEAILNGDLDEVVDALRAYDQAEKLKSQGEE